MSVASAFDYGLDDEVYEVDPVFGNACRRAVETATNPNLLPSKVQQLIGLAVNSAATHLNRPAVEAHVQEARRYGASDAEIVETLQIAACLGIHTLTFGAGILREESPELARAIAAPLTERQQELKQHWIDIRGGWLPAREILLEGDPDFFEEAARIQNIPVASRVLDPKIRELLYVALDSSCTHMHWGTRVHVKLALKLGATYQEVLATLALASLIGNQGYAWGIHALLEDTKDSSSSTAKS
jgi:alkylhydroperoxidase/carboxymuconolactone decarboxylase family protein YurZ